MIRRISAGIQRNMGLVSAVEAGMVMRQRGRPRRSSLEVKLLRTFIYALCQRRIARFALPLLRTRPHIQIPALMIFIMLPTLSHNLDGLAFHRTFPSA